MRKPAASASVRDLHIRSQVVTRKPTLQDVSRAAGQAEVPAKFARRRTLKLDGPVVGWLAADIRPDGSFDVLRDIGDDYLTSPTCAPRCAYPRPGLPPNVGVTRVRPVIATEHSSPFPFCHCGMPAGYAPDGRLFDHWRNRLGYRMRTVALVEVWGRVMLESGGMRAACGRVLAIAVADDESPARRARVASAAKLLGATVVEVDPARFETDAFEHLVLAGATRLTHRDFMRSLRGRSLRRWSSAQDARAIGLGGGMVASVALIVAIFVDAGVRALGIPGTVALAMAILIALAGLVGAFRLTLPLGFSIEAFAPSPDATPDLDATPIAVTLGPRKHQLKLAAGVGRDMLWFIGR